MKMETYDGKTLRNFTLFSLVVLFVLIACMMRMDTFDRIYALVAFPFVLLLVAFFHELRKDTVATWRFGKVNKKPKGSLSDPLLIIFFIFPFYMLRILFRRIFQVPHIARPGEAFIMLSPFPLYSLALYAKYLYLLIYRKRTKSFYSNDAESGSKETEDKED